MTAPHFVGGLGQFHANPVGSVAPEKLIDHAVERPAHYNAGSIECIDAIRAALTEEEFRGYCKGNALKYIWRERHKGHPGEDLQKAEWYLRKAADK